MYALGRLLAVAGMLLAAASVVEAPSASAATLACGNRADFPRSPRLSIIGLTDDQRLVTFRECNPGRAPEIGAIFGLQGDDTTIVGIDFRVQDGNLFGLADGGGIYVLDTTTAEATLFTQLTVPLDGALFDIDFNPAANALRIISDTGQNLRHPFGEGPIQFITQVDGPLTQGGDIALGVTGAAYVNNDLDPNTGTTLFDFNTVTDQIVIQSPPNDGVLVPTGSLTLDSGPVAGFDIFSIVRDGVVVANNGFAAFDVTGFPAFYRINLLTGQASLIAPFASSAVVDIAIPITQ